MKQLFTILFLLSFAFVNAVTINVPADQPTIQAGIDAATNTDTVLVQQGTYYENINYNGKLITVGSLFLTTHDTTYISSTTIDGNSSGSVVTFENSEDSTAIMCGFTIQNGNITGNGGGIYCYSSDPSLQNLTITGNTASVSGGGIYCYYSSPNITNVTITDNSAYIGGGGIYCYHSSSPNITNVTITVNSASTGGGIKCDYYSSPNITNVTITDNSAYNGGGIYCYNNSSPSLQNLTIIGNSANSGGGIYCYASNPSLINSILWNNLPDEIYIHSGSVTVTYSDIQGGWTGTGNLDSDPLFVNPGSGNYHLQPTSPCIDAGDPASPFDPDNTRSDMGAYYYHQFLHAYFTADITNGEYPLTVYFTDLSTQVSGEIVEWYWGFGDGNNSSLQHPANEYQLPGFYTVLLTVTDVNDSTDTETKVDYITVHSLSYSGPVWHISPTGSDVWGNGSMQYPFASIQHGINESSNTDTVLVQPGTYVENINYNGKLITISSLFLTSQDETYISSTTIDGNSSGSVVTFNNGEDATTVLYGFTITNGDGDASGSPYCGGGIYCEISSPSLQNVTITGNTASVGAGIYCEDSSPSLQNVTISDNSAPYYGGGIHCENSSPSLTNVTITANSADYVGGIYCYNNSNLILINSILWNNLPDEIYISTGSVTATYSDIQGGFTGTGNIDSDPLFVDSGDNNYNLIYTSPCIDTGDPVSSLDPDGSRADMGACYFDRFIGAPAISTVTDVPNDQGRSVIITWQRSIWDQAASTTPILSYGLWEKYPYEPNSDHLITNDINEAIKKQDTYFQREDTTWVFIANVPAMQWEEYSALAVTFFDSTTIGDYLSYFFVSAHTPIPTIYCSSSIFSGYSVDNIAPDETDVYIAQNGSNIGLSWDEVEYGTFLGNSYLEVNGIWYKIYAGDLPDFVCDEAHLIDTIIDLNYDYPLTGEERKFFKIVVSDQPAAGRINNVFKKAVEPADGYHKIEK